MKSHVAIESWEAVSKKAYWDRNVSLEKWRGMISIGHRSYLPDAVTWMNVAEFISFYGAKKFIDEWPELRSKLTGKSATRSRMYDLAWSRLAGGGWNLLPHADINTMPKRRRQFLTAIAKSPGKSIYEVAKSLGMQYRRAHEHAVNLISDKKVVGKEVVEGGHRKTKLYPAYKTDNVGENKKGPKVE